MNTPRTPSPPSEVAVVTGAASGIGAAAAELLIADGVRVVAVDVDEDGLKGLVDRSNDPDLLEIIVTDLSTTDGVEAVAQFIEAHHGSANMLHNNAGIIGEVGPLLESTVENFDRVMSVNARSAYLVLREMARLAVGAGRPMTVVNTSSTSALKSSRGLATYAMTKAAIVGLTRTAALELGDRGIRVNAIAPGRTDTPLAATLEARVADRVTAVSDRPIARAATPAEIAELAVWLLGPRSSFVTGSIYTIDGGLTA
jgi:NAD(P)-dependent dehydrogenase (short-subunit alcohol dehydrogenase family)